MAFAISELTKRAYFNFKVWPFFYGKNLASCKKIVRFLNMQIVHVCRVFMGICSNIYVAEGRIMVKSADKNKPDPVTAYQEKKIGKTLYRVTSVYMGQFELRKALEDLIIKKILRDENAAALSR